MVNQLKILIICSKAFYGLIDNWKRQLEQSGHEVFLPNCYDAPETESKYRGTDWHAKWKASMIRHSEETIRQMDAVLVLNYRKNNTDNYIGGATFLEIYDAFRLKKKIFFIHDIPEVMLKDELIGFSPVILHEDLSLVNDH